MTFFLPHCSFPKFACVVRGGPGAGIHLSWFPGQPVFTFLSPQTEGSPSPVRPALARLVLQMREDLPLDCYVVTLASSTGHWTQSSLKWKRTELPETNKLSSWVSHPSLFGAHRPSSLWHVPCGSLPHDWKRYSGQKRRLRNETNLTFLCNNM